VEILLGSKKTRPKEYLIENKTDLKKTQARPNKKEFEYCGISKSFATSAVLGSNLRNIIKEIVEDIDNLSPQ